MDVGLSLSLNAWIDGWIGLASGWIYGHDALWTDGWMLRGCRLLAVCVDDGMALYNRRRWFGLLTGMVWSCLSTCKSIHLRVDLFANSA